MNAEAAWIKPNERCWVEIPDSDKSDECYFQATIQSYDKQTGMVKIQPEDKSIKTKEVLSKLVLMRPEESDSVNDMVNMEILNDATLLYNLYQRYNKDIIYTYVGPTLIAVNPFKKIEKLFEPENLQYYNEKIL